MIAPRGADLIVRLTVPIEPAPLQVLWRSHEGKLAGLVHVVDDDASFRTAIERRLKLAGYEVASYASAQQLLDHLPDAEKPACILLDVKIPGLSGPELQARLVELGSMLPIVF